MGRTRYTSNKVISENMESRVQSLCLMMLRYQIWFKKCKFLHVVKAVKRIDGEFVSFPKTEFIRRFSFS